MSDEYQAPDALLRLADGHGVGHFVWCLLADVVVTKLEGSLPLSEDRVMEIVDEPLSFWDDWRLMLVGQVDQAIRAKDAMARVALDPANRTKVVEQRNAKIMSARLLKQRLESVKEQLPTGRGLPATLRHSLEGLLVTRVCPLATQNIRKPPEPDDDKRTAEQRLSGDAAYQNTVAGVTDAHLRLSDWVALRGFFEELQALKPWLDALSTGDAPPLDIDVEDLPAYHL